MNPKSSLAPLSFAAALALGAGCGAPSGGGSAPTTDDPRHFTELPDEQQARIRDVWMDKLRPFVGTRFDLPQVAYLVDAGIGLGPLRPADFVTPAGFDGPTVVTWDAAHTALRLTPQPEAVTRGDFTLPPDDKGPLLILLEPGTGLNDAGAIVGFVFVSESLAATDADWVGISPELGLLYEDSRGLFSYRPRALVGEALATRGTDPLWDEFADVWLDGGITAQPARATAITDPVAYARDLFASGQLGAGALALTFLRTLEDPLANLSDSSMASWRSAMKSQSEEVASALSEVVASLPADALAGADLNDYLDLWAVGELRLPYFRATAAYECLRAFRESLVPAIAANATTMEDIERLLRAEAEPPAGALFASLDRLLPHEPGAFLDELYALFEEQAFRAVAFDDPASREPLSALLTSRLGGQAFTAATGSRVFALVCALNKAGNLTPEAFRALAMPAWATLETTDRLAMVRAFAAALQSPALADDAARLQLDFIDKAPAFANARRRYASFLALTPPDDNRAWLALEKLTRRFVDEIWAPASLVQRGGLLVEATADEAFPVELYGLRSAWGAELLAAAQEYATEGLVGTAAGLADFAGNVDAFWQLTDERRAMDAAPHWLDRAIAALAVGCELRADESLGFEDTTLPSLHYRLSFPLATAPARALVVTAGPLETVRVDVGPLLTEVRTGTRQRERPQPAQADINAYRSWQDTSARFDEEVARIEQQQAELLAERSRIEREVSWWLPDERRTMSLGSDLPYLSVATADIDAELTRLSWELTTLGLERTFGGDAPANPFDLPTGSEAVTFEYDVTSCEVTVELAIDLELRDDAGLLVSERVTFTDTTTFTDRPTEAQALEYARRWMLPEARDAAVDFAVRSREQQFQVELEAYLARQRDWIPTVRATEGAWLAYFFGRNAERPLPLGNVPSLGEPGSDFGIAPRKLPNDSALPVTVRSSEERAAAAAPRAAAAFASLLASYRDDQSPR